MSFKLLTEPYGNPKTAKGEAAGWSTAILHLAPAGLAGRGSVCPWSTAGCRAACLNKAGRGGMFARGARTNAIQRARVRRTRAFFDNREGFLRDLRGDVERHAARCARDGKRPAVRLNGTSDIAWESVAPEIFAGFPGVTFYDYTKSEARMSAMLAMRDWHKRYTGPDWKANVIGRTVPRHWPANYDLTFSWSGENAKECATVLAHGGRVAVAFDRVPVGRRFSPFWGDGSPMLSPLATRLGWPVVDGDASDLRFLEPGGIIVGLRAKGPAKKDRTGFVVRVS